jgi:hypothetical protein
MSHFALNSYETISQKHGKAKLFDHFSTLLLKDGARSQYISYQQAKRRNKLALLCTW